MSQQTKKELLEHWRPKYQQAGRGRKHQILNEFCELTGHERKHAIKLMNGQVGRRRNPPGRKRRYGEDVLSVLKALWSWTDQLGSKHLVAALPEWLPYYEQRTGALPPALRKKLLEMSAATVDRLLAPYRVKTDSWRRRMPKPGTILRAQIPVRTGPWEVTSPGWLEVDTVPHSGGSMAGNFLWSLTLTDIFTGWTCGRAIWNCGQHGVVEAVQGVEASLPFPLLGFDSDNGHEFINHHLRHYLMDRPRAVDFTRSRAYHKNDNAHVEQKNWTHVRHLLGYERLEHPELVDAVNDLYRTAWDPLKNFFMPSVKLTHKQRLGSRYRKTYDLPQTPFQRLIRSGTLTRQARKHLQDQKRSLNPLILKEQVEVKLKAIWELVRKLDKEKMASWASDRLISRCRVL